MKSATHVTGPLVKLIIFIVITVVTTAILGISIANINMTKTSTYTARFSDATLLLENDDVRISGVRVGQVTDVRVADRNQAEVEFAVDAGKRLPTSTTATVKFRNLVGQRYVSLDPGPEADGPPLPNDGSGRIPIENTRPALDLTELFNGFRPLFTALSPKDINQLSYQIIQVMQGEGGTVESLLAHTASLTTTLAEKDQVIGEVINNLNVVLDTLNAKGPQVKETVDTLQRLVSGLAEDAKPIGDAVESIDDLARTTSGFLTDARKPLKDDIAELGRATKLLNDNEDLIEHWITFGPEKYTTIGRTASYGSWFNFYVCSSEVTLRLPGGAPPVEFEPTPPPRERCGTA
ncbi:MAG: MCE family protein [Actinophytocola sp.]|nr:MCE family protein [Actinophytocola sp.]